MADTSPNENFDQDQDLVQRLLLGEAAAWKAFEERFGKLIWGIVWRYAGGNNEDAEDMYQEVCVHLFQKLPLWKPKGPLGGWIARVTANKCLELIRSRMREKNLNPMSLTDVEEQGIEVPSTSPDPRRLAMSNEMRLIIEECLSQLPDNYRSALDLWLLGYSYKDIAEIRGVDSKTVATWIHRGKKVLCECIEKKAGEDWLS
ncbi:RNA polymerase sigma factor [Candidatus Sumerlaeota bacterium]|nr:RNA polymerase sigma factor [Candidatus Sumerlaeota bacterium]